MSYLLDTNLLLRLSEPGTAACELATAAVARLQRAGEDLCICPQNVAEFWNSATRPADRNGLGWTVAQADAAVSGWERLFRLVPDTPAIYPEWRSLVVSVGVSGVQVHDARLAATMIVHGIGSVLTVNARDLARSPGVTVVEPAAVRASAERREPDA